MTSSLAHVTSLAQAWPHVIKLSRGGPGSRDLQLGLLEHVFELGEGGPGPALRVPAGQHHLQSARAVFSFSFPLAASVSRP